MPVPVREWHVKKALKSFRSLTSIIGELTEEEVLHVLQVESESRRRSVMLDKLIQKAAELNRHIYIANLKEKIHGTQQIRRTDAG